MVQESLKTRVSVVIDENTYRRLHDHLFPGDADEHGAVLLAGISTTPRGTRLLVREMLPALDGVEYVPGTRGYRALTARFVAEVSGRCADEKLCYLSVHCHGGTDSVGFSGDDLASHERGYPALLDINEGRPVGALVFARNAVAGDIWTENGRFAVDHLRVVGKHVRDIYPTSARKRLKVGLSYNRQTRIFGDLGQEILRGLKIGIIGLGGGGSLLNEWLSRLGVGHIVAVDCDRVHLTNLPRVVGSSRWDARWPFSASGIQMVENVAKRFSVPKVHVARRVARRANPKIKFEAIVGDVLDEQTALKLRDVDFLFLATDSIQSRLVFNALVMQYMIPGVQVGAKVSANRATGDITDIFTATRLVLPGVGTGCLDCANCIPASRLQAEAMSEKERAEQRYIDDPDVAEPSVITLNALSAAPAANDLMMMFTGLYYDSAELLHQMNFARERRIDSIEAKVNPNCLDCGELTNSRRSRGDAVRLPCRQQSSR